VSNFIDSEYGTLREVALSAPEHYDWAAENAIVTKTKLLGLKVNPAAAQSQHREMVAALEEAGVTCQFLATDPHLPMQTFARDDDSLGSARRADGAT
jgi:arginine deiminase